MIDKNLFLSILFGFASVYLAIGIWASRKVRTLKNYFLADRNLGVFKLTFALIATQLGSGLLLGSAQRAYKIGFWGICYAVGLGAGFILLSFGFAARMRALNISTTAEIFETHYGSISLKYFASLLSIISLWGILLAQIIASKMVFEALGITDPYILIGFWFFLIFYTMLGGLESVALIDAIQVFLILSVFTYIFFYGIPINKAAAYGTKVIPKIQNYFFSKRLNVQEFLPTLLMPTLFALIEQDLAQRFFAAKTKLTATISAFMASLIIIAFSCIPISLGIYAKMKKVSIPQGGDPLLPLLAAVTTKLVFVLAICAIIAAITSTADSLLSAISSNIAQDFQAILPMKGHKLFVSKLICFITGTSALITSFFIPSDIIFILENSYRVSVICLFVPTVVAYFARQLHPLCAWISILCGIVGFVYCQYTPLTSPILKDIIPLISSLAGYMFTYSFFPEK